MSIATAIQNAKAKVANAYSAVSERGGTLPQTQNLSNLLAAINSIPAGGGDELEVLNLTGSTLNVGDKAWLSPMYLGSAPDASQFGSYGSNGAFSPNVVSRDGSVVFDAKAGVLFNTSTKATTTVAQANSSISGYSGVVKYADNGMIWAYKNAAYNASNKYWISVGGGSYGEATQYAYVGGDYYYDAVNSQFVKMAAGTMNVIKTYTDNTSVGTFTQVALCGLSFCYANGYIYYKSSNPRIWRAIVDDEAGTITDDALMLDNTSNQFVLPYVTSDGAYFLAYEAYSSLHSNYNFRIFSLANNTLQEVSDVSSLSPDLLQFYNNTNSIYSYNQQDDILTITNKDTKEIAVFKYANAKFTKIAGYVSPVDNPSSMYATASTDGLVISYDPGAAGNNQTKVIQFAGNAEYKVVNYQNINISSSSLTGYVTEGGVSGATVKVATVMPEQINVNVTVNADNAIISGGIE